MLDSEWTTVHGLVKEQYNVTKTAIDITLEAEAGFLFKPAERFFLSAGIFAGGGVLFPRKQLSRNEMKVPQDFELDMGQNFLYGIKLRAIAKLNQKASVYGIVGFGATKIQTFLPDGWFSKESLGDMKAESFTKVFTRLGIGFEYETFKNITTFFEFNFDFINDKKSRDNVMVSNPEGSEKRKRETNIKVYGVRVGARYFFS